MEFLKRFLLISGLIFVSFLLRCNRIKEEFTGTYCLNLQNIEMSIIQDGDNVTFSLNVDLLGNGTGSVSGDTLILTATTPASEVFTSSLAFSNDRKSFSGPFKIVNSTGNTAMEGTLFGNKGGCVEFDVVKNGIPQFVGKDFTSLSKIEKISKFRSGFGHSFTDGSESCRSMKHYYNPYQVYRQNNTVEIYSPVDGTIVSVANDGQSTGTGLTNVEIQIKPDNQPAFVFVLYHCDLASEMFVVGKKVSAGDLIGYAAMYYADQEKYVTSFDIAVWVNTPSGMKLISYFETMRDDLFNTYKMRGVTSRQDFIISKEARDEDPLNCDGESFLTSGNIENFVTLN